MFLLDANIFLEGLLEQEKTSEVRSFFRSRGFQEMFITDLALHSIGIILYRLKKYDLFAEFLQDMIIDGIHVLSVKLQDLRDIRAAAKRFQLDFEDAYQYIAAEKHNLTLVSFDADFDRTERGRTTPQAVLSRS